MAMATEQVQANFNLSATHNRVILVTVISHTKIHDRNQI